MRYYLSDFIRMGAAFVPVKKPTTLPSGALLFHGNLHYCDNTLAVAVLAKKEAPARIVGVGMVGSPANGYVSQKNILRKIFLKGIKDDVSNLRSRVFIRLIISILLMICVMLMFVCSLASFVGLFLYKKISFFLFFLSSIFLLRLFWKRRWAIIPYGGLGE